MSPLPVYRVTDRFVLNPGTECNARCPFCYYLSELEHGGGSRLPTPALQRRVDLAARWGKRAVDISGGEPTVRPDLAGLVTHCRHQGVHRVTLITNGLRLHRREPVESLRDAGLTDVILSVHGHTDALHDLHTGVPGSFARLTGALHNLRGAGLGVRTNTVVTAANLPHLDAVLAYLHGLGIAEVNLLVLNPSLSAAHLPVAHPFHHPDLVAAGAALDGATTRWKPRFELVNVRFLPFCLLPTHPGSVRTQWQKLHEDHEWDPVLNVAFQRGRLAAMAAAAAGLALRRGTPRYRAADLPTRAARSLSATRMRLHYRHGPPCAACSVRAICAGLPRALVARGGFPPLRPVELDRPVTDPLHFVKDQPEAFASLRQIPRRPQASFS